MEFMIRTQLYLNSGLKVVARRKTHAGYQARCSSQTKQYALFCWHCNSCYAYHMHGRKGRFLSWKN